MLTLYKMQLVNQSNQEILIEYQQHDNQFFRRFIDICQETDGKDCYIFDSNHRIYNGQFLKYTINRTDIEKVYQLFFHATLASNILL